MKCICNPCLLLFHHTKQTKSIHFYIYLFYSTNIETEVAKYLRSLVESQLSQLSLHYGVIGSDFQKLCLQDGIIDTTRSNLLHAYSMNKIE